MKNILQCKELQQNAHLDLLKVLAFGSSLNLGSYGKFCGIRHFLINKYFIILEIFRQSRNAQMKQKLCKFTHRTAERVETSASVRGNISGLGSEFLVGQVQKVN